jgi:hypothetical protein
MRFLSINLTLDSARRRAPLGAAGLLAIFMIASQSVAQLNVQPPVSGRSAAEAQSLGAPAAGRDAQLSGWQRWWSERAFGVLAEYMKPEAATDQAAWTAGPEVLEALRQALAEGTGAERCAAALALARSGGSGALADLVLALADAPADVQPALVLALGVLGSPDARPYLAGLARDTRFGRGTLGRSGTPVPVELRAAAVLGLGFLPVRARQDDIRELVLKGGQGLPVEVHWAACRALGLRIAPAETAALVEPPTGAFGPALTDAAFVEHELDAYLAVIDKKKIDPRARGALIASLGRLAPTDSRVRGAIVRALGADERPSIHGALEALTDQMPIAGDDLTAALWRGVKNPAFGELAGWALLALGRSDSEADFARLCEQIQGPRSLVPFAAFALVEAAKREGERRMLATAALRRWLDAPVAGGDEAGAVCLALGLLEDASAAASLTARADFGATEAERAAAVVSLGLLRRTDPDDLSRVLRRLAPSDRYAQNAAAWACALTANDRTSSELCLALSRARDRFSLEGIAGALGLVRDPASISTLVRLVGDPKTSADVRPFALRALGLLFAGPLAQPVELVGDLRFGAM